MRFVTTACLSAGLTLALAACSEEPETASPDQAAAEQGGDVSGDVLGGTISDAMIPLDQLQSKSPPLRGASGDSADESEESEDTTDAANDGEDPVPAPAQPTAPPTANPPASPTVAPPLQTAPPLDDGSGR